MPTTTKSPAPPRIYDLLAEHRYTTESGVPTESELGYAIDAISAVWEFWVDPIQDGLLKYLNGDEGRLTGLTNDEIGRLVVWADYVRDMIDSIERCAVNVAVAAKFARAGADGTPLTDHGFPRPDDQFSEEALRELYAREGYRA